MISPIQLSPSMDMSTLVNAVNTTLRQIEAENRTRITRDEDGIDRIILGRFPDGQYGLIISKPGKDVKDLFTT